MVESLKSLSSSEEEYSGAVSNDELESWRERVDESSKEDDVLLFEFFLERLRSCLSLLEASLTSFRVCLIS